MNLDFFSSQAKFIKLIKTDLVESFNEAQKDTLLPSFLSTVNADSIKIQYTLLCALEQSLYDIYVLATPTRGATFNVYLKNDKLVFDYSHEWRFASHYGLEFKPLLNQPILGVHESLRSLYRVHFPDDIIGK